MNFDEKLKSIPARPGVYLFKNKEGRILYVGKAKILRNRVRSYFQQNRPFDPRLLSLIKRIADFEFIVTDSDVEALILEANLIKENKPRYNINLKDDKSYPHIRITNEDFPQVFATRTLVRDGSTYFGPYTNVKEIRYALTTLKRLFAIRSCKYDLNAETVAKKKVQLCLDYFIKKCKGPCQQLQSKDDYAQTIERIRQFLKGKTSGILAELRQEMQSLAERQEFEEAARVRDKIEALEKYRNAQKVVSDEQIDRDIFAVAREDDDACAVIFKVREGKILGRVHYYLAGVLHKEDPEILEYFINQYYTVSDEIPRELFLPLEIDNQAVIEEWLRERSDRHFRISIPKSGEKKKLLEMCQKNAGYLLEELKLQKMKRREKAVPHVLRSLQRDLRLSKPPNRIECFDISNIQGSDPVASMVCFIAGKPRKNEYRHFKIQSQDTPDDFAMMREVVSRRYSRLLKEEQPLPDLIIVDGGKGQLSSAVSVLAKLEIKDQPIIGLAKRLEEIFFPGMADAQMLPRTSSSLKLLQQLRNEAHRFAVTFHRQRRSKRTLTSQLDEIPGVGPKTRNRLLQKFGSLKRIQELTQQQLQNEGKLPEKLAENIYKYLHKKNS